MPAAARSARWTATMLLVLVLCRAEPPKEMPEELVKAYTMNGKAEQARFFVDDTNGGKGSHYKYVRTSMEQGPLTQ
jgi:hypothetical protein